MESRTRFAIGGVSTVVASIAVVCAVALTNSVAMADAPGAPIGAAPIVVPSSSASASAVAPTAQAQASQTKAVASSTRTAAVQAVPAPAPIVVAGQVATQASLSTAVLAVAEAKASGSWQPVRDWAARNRWSQERIDAWIVRLEKKSAKAQHSADELQRIQGELSSPKKSAKAEHQAERQAAKSWHGSKKDRSRDSPDRRD